MGSKKFHLDYEYTLNNFYLNSSDLIEMIIKKLFSKHVNINELKRTYRLYENVCGVERLVGKDENILSLVSNQIELKSNVYYTIRKKELKTNFNRKKLNVKKCFAKLKSDAEMKKRQNIMICEEMNDQNNDIKNELMKRIFQNEIVLNNQIKKMDSLDKLSEQKNGSKPNQSLFQSIYDKLKHHHHKRSMNQSSLYLIDSAGECSTSTSASSSPYTSSTKLDTLF